MEQAVPDPSCKPTGGTITGENVSLDIAGLLRNSGVVSASDTLNVKAGSRDLSPNVVDIGKSAYGVSGGWMEYTGTQVQPGGFMSAMHMNIGTDSINAVNDALRVLRADGTVDESATNALIAQLKSNLGSAYTEGSVSDDIHTHFIKQDKGLGPIGQVIAIAGAVAIAIVTAGAGTTIVGAVTSSAFAASAVGAAVSMAVSGLIAGTLSSMVGQVITTGSIDLGAALKSGLVSAATAGLMQGALGAMGLANAGVSSIGTNISVGNWAAVQANLTDALAASVVRSAISAGINTVAYGGSFGRAFANGIVRDVAAVGANAIGATLPGIDTDGATPSTITANAVSHALLGCAAQSLTGGDCAGGAIGGAASALAAPLIRDGLYGGSQTVTNNPDGTQTIKYKNDYYNATTAALATLIGGSVGILLGANATSAASAASNESLNNALSMKIVPRPVPTPFGVVMMPMPVVTDDPIGTPNNGPQKTDPLTNPLEEQNSKGNAIATPNNGPQGSTLTGTPALTPQGSTILGNPGCGSAAGLPCAAVTVMASVKDGIDKLSNVLGGNATSVPLGLGSTGRSTPNNLQEQLALQQAMSNPAAGVQLPIPLGDSRWPAADGWVKMSQNVNGIEIHYVRNVNSGAIDDFKFK